MTRTRLLTVLSLTILAATVACAKKKPPVANPIVPPPTIVPSNPSNIGAPKPPTPQPPEPIAEPPAVPKEPVVLPNADDPNSKDLDTINKMEILKPAFFALDGDTLDDVAQQALSGDADTLKKYPAWQITIEGHCDERGTAEYNLALGERRALAAKNYLVSLGVAPERVKTVSYGKEFPFDPGHEEAAFSKNRRAHFVVTAK